MTAAPFSATPVIVGVVSFVRSSAVVPVVPVPALSDAVSRSIVGVAVDVSTVTASAVDAELRVPAPSSAFAVSEWIPSASVLLVIDHVPVVPAAPCVIVPLVTAVPSTVVPFVSYSVT